MRNLLNLVNYSKSAFKSIKTELNPANKSYTITLANPSKRNTLSYDTLSQISASLSEVEQEAKNQKVKTLFIKSQGPVFSSGHDLKELTIDNKAEKIFKLCGDTLINMTSIPVPVIGVVNGLAAAAGLQLIASCDLVLASEKSTFSCPGVKWGVFCTTPGIALIRSMTSPKKALEMLFTGQAISAAQAYNFGLVTKVVKESELDQEVTRYADMINKLSGEVIALGKKAFIEQRNKASLKEAYDGGVRVMCENLTKQDSKQGLKAFAEKRHPHYKN